jgi:hypothetical protein
MLNRRDVIAGITATPIATVTVPTADAELATFGDQFADIVRAWAVSGIALAAGYRNVIMERLAFVERQGWTDWPVRKELAMPSLTIPDLPFSEYEAQEPPKLSFTKVVAASFNGKAVSWNRLLDTALKYAAKEISDFEKLRNIAAVNMVKGKKTKEGYRYLPEADLSVQGQKNDSGLPQ